MFFLQKQILQGPLASLPWDWAEAFVVAALLFFGQDVLEDVFRKFAPFSLKVCSLTGSSGTGIFCLSFMYILNILTGTLLWKVNHIGSQSSSEHSNAGILWGSVVCPAEIGRRRGCPWQEAEGEHRSVPSLLSSAVSPALLAFWRAMNTPAIGSQLQWGLGSLLWQPSLWCVFDWPIQGSTNKYLALFPGTEWSWNYSRSVTSRMGLLCCGGAES